MFPDKGKDVLLAEDNANGVELTVPALQKHNIANRVTVIWSGAAASNYLYREGKFAQREETPAAILLDLKMPKVDGLEDAAPW